MAADTYAKGPLWDPDPDKPSLPFIILNTSYSEESNTLFTTSLLCACACTHAIYFRLWAVIRNLISRLSLFMVCLYSLILMPTLSTNLNNSSPPLVFIFPEVLTAIISPCNFVVPCWTRHALLVSSLKHHILNSICGSGVPYPPSSQNHL